MDNLEKIFLYFARPGTSLLFYKDFIKEIFHFTSIKDKKIKYRNNIIYDNLTFIEELTRKIINKNGIFSLLELIKNIKIIDYEHIRRINLNEFILALKKSDIILDDSQKEKLFIEHNFFLNGIIKYEIMINLILEEFWNEEKNNLTEELYCMITNNGKKYISLNSVQKIFENIMDDSYSKQKLIKLFEEYKLINNKISINPISLKDFKNFFKFYNFGNSSDKCLKELLSILQSKLYFDDNDLGRHNKMKNSFNNENNYPNKRRIFSKSMDKFYSVNNRNRLFQIIKRLRIIFTDYGRKSLFNFIKLFRYYENSEQQIDRNNFRKVFNSYNISLSVEEIEIIFEKFSINEFKNLIYYEDFLKYMVVNSSNNRRENIIKYVYNTIMDRADNYNQEINIEFLKDLYNPKNNFFKKDETDNNLEFIDCLEIFHYFYKSFKTSHFSKREFIDFYRFIGFLIYSDEDFISLILNEWNISLTNINTILSNLNNEGNDKINNNNLYERENLKNFFLYDLKNKLKSKGVKGLINLHWKFISFCSNVSKITLYDFINILQLEHINLENDIYNEIFNYFSLEDKNQLLDYDRFIRYFKKELNDNKLNIVEKIFLSLKYDNGDTDEIPLNEVKKRYMAKRHPEVIMGKISEDEKIREFRESFDINYNICNIEQNNNKLGKFVDFDIFANFYEYVSFIYYEDEDFTNLLISTWC